MNGRIFLPDTGYFSAVIDTTNSVNDNSNFIPDRFSLMQNYPNPFNPTTKIKFSIPTLEFVTLKVYDVLGNEVATLVNEEKPAGSYEVEFKSSFGNRQLANGVYFYQLKTGGDYLETKKMILLK
uniref:T9SS type A sorting domain-containing protein n=1 Tax=Ignavibacterium album TaxID=591197 RepID=A0A832CZ84_9BACT